MTDKKPITSQRTPEWECNSDEEYNALTDQLAKELRRDCTPEHIAVIAAQHMIYVRELNAQLDAQNGLLDATNKLIDCQSETIQAKDNQLQIEIGKIDFLARNTARIAKIAIDAYPKFASKKATDSLHDTNRKRKEAAIKHWETSGLKNATEFARRHHEAYGVTQRAICKWISDYKSDNRKKTDL